ncbi:MAG TPA: HigA family addiction module antitoxin [Candidatus Obscuribacterales bacterium]
MSRQTELQELSNAACPRPGDVLRTAFMSPAGLTSKALALALRVTPQRMAEILDGRRGISAETALRLSKLFGTSPQFWLYLQSDYDLHEARKKWPKDLDRKIKHIDVTSTVSWDKAKGAKDNTKERPAPERRPTVDLHGAEKTIFELLSDEKIHFDALIEKSGLQAGEISAALTMLELSEVITRYPYDWYSRR